MARTRILLAAAALVGLGVAPVAAQMGDSPMMFGIKGGVTFSTVSVEDDEGVDISNLTAFGGGAFLRIPLGGIGLQPEALYVRKGASVTGNEFDGGSVDLKLDYIEIPVLLVVPIGTGDIAPYLFGGGAVAFETGCTFSAESTGVSFDVDCDDNDVDLEVERKSTDFGAVFGAGLRLPAGSGSFLIEGRYTLGLADLDDSGSANGGFKNRSIAAFIGYAFNIGG